MIYFNVGLFKNLELKQKLRIKTNGLMFWTENNAGEFVNPYFNTPENIKLFEDVLDLTPILSAPLSHMVAENNDGDIIHVLTNDL